VLEPEPEPVEPVLKPVLNRFWVLKTGSGSGSTGSKETGSGSGSGSNRFLKTGSGSGSGSRNFGFVAPLGPRIGCQPTFSRASSTTRLRHCV
jgi:hypothetical protein